MSEVLDMSRFIEAKSDQLNADDLIGTSKTITVTKVTGSDGDQPVAIHYEGDNGKPFKPCKTIRRVLVGVWGKYASEYVGRSMTLYRDDHVTFGGLEVGGIRISHMSHIDKEMLVVVMKSKGKKVGIKIQPLSASVQSLAPAFTIEEARQAIADAPDLDALKTAWLRKPMAPFREQLQAELDARKAELTPTVEEGRADEQRGEATTLADALADIRSCTERTDINPRVATYEGQLSEEDMMELRAAAMDRLAELKD